MFDNVSIDASIDSFVSIKGTANETVVPRPGDDFILSLPPVFFIINYNPDKPRRLRFIRFSL